MYPLHHSNRHTRIPFFVKVVEHGYYILVLRCDAFRATKISHRKSKDVTPNHILSKRLISYQEKHRRVYPIFLIHDVHCRFTSYICVFLQPYYHLKLSTVKPSWQLKYKKTVLLLPHNRMFIWCNQVISNLEWSSNHDMWDPSFSKWFNGMLTVIIKYHLSDWLVYNVRLVVAVYMCSG